MSNLKTGDVKYVVIIDRGSGRSRIFYAGDSEVQAYKRYKELQFPNKEIVRATVKMTTLHGFELIESIDVIEKIV